MPECSRDEYLFLEYPVEFSIPVCCLLKRDLNEFLNRPGHRLERAEVADLLMSLYERQEIRFNPAGDLKTVNPSRSDVLACLDRTEGHRDLYYGLTRKGGTRWETLTSPRWDRQVSFSSTQMAKVFDEKAPWVGELVTEHRRTAELFMSIMHCHGNHVIDGSLKWKTLKPCRVKYWKTVPEGVRVNCRYTIDRDWLSTGGWTKIPGEYMYFFHPAGWFTRPFGV